MTWRHGLLGLLAYLAGLLAFAPASLLVPLAERYGDGRVQLQAVHGGVWNGGAERLSLRLDGVPPVVLQQVRWRLRPLRLVLGQPALYLESAGGDLRFSTWLRPGAGGLALRDLRADSRLDTLVRYLPRRDNPALRLAAQLQGDLRLEAVHLVLGRDYAGELTAHIRQTRAGLPLPPGDYRIDLHGEGRRLALRWHGPAGPRAMSGGGHFDGTLHLDGLPLDTAR